MVLAEDQSWVYNKKNQHAKPAKITIQEWKNISVAQQQEPNRSNKNAAKQAKKIGNNADLIKLAALRHSTTSENRNFSWKLAAEISSNLSSIFLHRPPWLHLFISLVKWINKLIN
jgi:hypothetical protein